MKKGNKLYGIIRGACPRCQESKLFTERNPYKLNKIYSMHKTCSSCGLDFEPEPFFYFGAMFVSYAFSVAIVIGVFVVSLVFFEDPNPNIMSAVGITAAVLFAPLNLRWSRIIWLSVFTNYNPKFKEKKPTED